MGGSSAIACNSRRHDHQRAANSPPANATTHCPATRITPRALRRPPSDHAQPRKAGKRVLRIRRANSLRRIAQTKPRRTGRRQQADRPVPPTRRPIAIIPGLSIEGAGERGSKAALKSIDRIQTGTAGRFIETTTKPERITKSLLLSVSIFLIVLPLFPLCRSLSQYVLCLFVRFSHNPHAHCTNALITPAHHHHFSSSSPPSLNT